MEPSREPEPLPPERPLPLPPELPEAPERELPERDAVVVEREALPLEPAEEAAPPRGAA